MNNGSYDLETLTDQGDLGKEPSEKYLESLYVLDSVVRESMSVAKRYEGIPSPTGRHFYASVLFTAMITRGVSMLNLAPHTPWADKRIEHWDYASLAVISRTLIELRVAFHYLCTEECTEAEWQCRWNILNLHDCVSRIRLFEAKGDAEEVSLLKVQADELRERLKTNEYFQSLDSRRHKKLLHGQSAYLFALEEMAEKAGIALEMFRFLYVLFSSHVHALPMSFYRMGGDNPERGRGLPSEIEQGYSSLCLSFAATLFTATRDEVHTLFEDIVPPTSHAQTEGIEEEIAEPTLKVGETALHDASEEIQIRFTKVTEDKINVEYIYKNTEEVVLERSSSEQAGEELKWFEPVFWSVEVNDGPTTEKFLIEALTEPHAYKVDHINRLIKFKTMSD
ncbi:hypothetical protein J5J10_20880 [Ciceribacter sp. L1K23]|uniref:DUF5677 domain-containing protein n=1 Tax=Ciceribacter sp. L1K23 TaxID=2820276 RepID=UPI001B8101CE|nr:DUF5677 domain-containing protein [Ciceribacter sp. L1K23]MBR0558155.1 hypothetical protein [Ciceribacter sp. L1K23]